MSRPQNSSHPTREHPTRRAVLAAAPAVPAAGVLAGCGGSDSGDTPSAPASPAGSPASGASAATGSGGVTVATSQVPVGGGHVEAAAKVVVTQPVAGTYKAFGAVCPHRHCLVSRVADGQIICPCHGSRFDVATGKVVAGPAQEGLPSRTVSVAGSDLTIT